MVPKQDAPAKKARPASAAAKKARPVPALGASSIAAPIESKCKGVHGGEGGGAGRGGDGYKEEAAKEEAWRKREATVFGPFWVSSVRLIGEALQ